MGNLRINATMRRARLDLGENFETSKNKTLKTASSNKCDHPPAQLWLKDAVSCTSPLPRLLGWPGRHYTPPSVPVCGLIDHPIRRGDGDGMQDSENCRFDYR